MSAPSSPPPQVFLSYGRNDLAAADELRERLRAAGLDGFKDDASIRAGNRWFDRLEAAVSQCTWFVVLVGCDGIARWVGAGAGVLPPFLSLFQAERWSLPHRRPRTIIPRMSVSPSSSSVLFFGRRWRKAAA